MKKEIPLFGVIAASGGSWTVTHKPTRYTHSQTQGYGEFPFDRYPGIPVIDYRPADTKLIIRLVLNHDVDEAYSCKAWLTNPIPLAKYIELAKQTGAKIL
jgi:hypothetical protein